MKLVLESKLMKELAERFFASVREGEAGASSVTITVDRSGLGCLLVDKSMISTVYLELPPKFFTEFEVDGEAKIRVNLQDLQKVLKRSQGGGELLGISHDDQKKRLKLQFRGKTGRTFSLRLEEEPEEDEKNEQDLLKNLDELKMEATCEIPPEILSDAAKDAAIIGDQMRIGLGPAGLSLRSEGDAGDFDELVELGDGSAPGISGLDLADGPVGELVFPLSYLGELLKCSTLAKTIKLGIGSGLPMRLTFYLQNDGTITAYVAPHDEIEEGGEAPATESAADCQEDPVGEEGGEME